ncbi:unnamed protein product [Heterosigma akashiwo]
MELLADGGNTMNKWCVEFGAWDGKHLSNTWSLINEHGWSSVQIEGDPEKFQELAARYCENPKVTCIQTLVDFEGASSLDAILSATAIPKDPDVVCIDIDGADYHVWESLETHNPKLIIVEFNPTIPNHVAFVQPRSMSVHQGSSLLALVDLGKRKGYELVCCTLFNAFFVPRRHLPLFQLPDNSPGPARPPWPGPLPAVWPGTLVTAAARNCSGTAAP